nr:Chain E, SPI peptide from Influenza A virus [unidentified influenza virus]5WMN_F Chain F, SPI peptide from Influenza A virus [unidentified influenza virus]
SPIVPSFDM